VKMRPRERVLCALSGGQPDRIPFCEASVAPNIGRALADSERDLSERELCNLLGRDAAIVQLFPPYFADQEVGSDGQPYVTTGWIKTRADLERMVFPDPHHPSLYEGARRLLAEKGDLAACASIKLGVAPTLITMGLDGFSFALKDDPGLIEEVLRRYVDWQLIVTQHLVDMGFDFLWAFDDVAYKSGPFCSPPVFRQFFMPAFRRSAEAITVPWIFHSDGNIMPLLEDLITLGMNGLHPIEPGPMDLAAVKAQYGRRLCIVGNVSVDLLSSGTPEQVQEAVRRCISVAGPGGGYMISSSNSIPGYADPTNVRVMAQAIRDYGAYPLALAV
jgi:uroporphyrinogen-III decarboxylase